MSNTYFLQSIRFCNKCENTLILKTISNNTARFECRFCFETFSFPIPRDPIYKSSKSECENIDPSLLKHYKSDRTLPLQQVCCPKCDFPQASVLTNTNSLRQKLSILYLCQRKSPKCDFSWK